MLRQGAKESSSREQNGIFQTPLLTHLWNKGGTSLLSTCCNALSCLLFFISVLERLQSSNQSLAVKRLPHAITERKSWRTQWRSRETFEINLKATALFSCVAFCCPVILYVDYNRKIKFLIFSSLYLEKCKNSYTWCLQALLSQTRLPILCHCHLFDDGLLVCVRAFSGVALVNTKDPISKSHYPVQPNST